MKDTHKDPVTANKTQPLSSQKKSPSRAQKSILQQASQWLVVLVSTAGIVYVLGSLFKEGFLPQILHARKLKSQLVPAVDTPEDPLIPVVEPDNDEDSEEAQMQEDVPANAPGAIVLLSRLESETLVKAGISAEKIFSVGADRAFYFFRSENELSQLPEGHFEIFGNAYGRLQSLPQRDVDPGAYLQWHHYSWPSLLVDRFPLSVDQNFPRTRFDRPEEFRFWKGTGKLNKDDLKTRACPHHYPVTTNSYRLWQLGEIPSTGPALILQDSLPDFSHPDLKGAGQLLVSDPVSQPDDHGTHVAGLLSAKQDDLGVTGVVPGLKILSAPIRVLENSGERFVTLRDVLVGLDNINQYYSKPSAHSERGVSIPARVALLNYGFVSTAQLSGFSSPLRIAVERLLSNDVAVVVPAGNKTDNSSEENGLLPAAFDFSSSPVRGVLVPVSSSDICSHRAWFTRVVPFGRGHVLFAPGERIYSTIVGNDFGYLSGTSQSAAQIAGILARSSLEFPAVSMSAQASALEKTSQVLRNSNATRDIVPDGWEFIQELRNNTFRAGR